MHWARTKAETESDLAACGLGGCVTYRPAMILPDVEPDRFAWFQRLGASLGRPFASHPRLAITNTAIGEAMIQATLDGIRSGTLDNAEIRALADCYRAGRS